MPVLSRFYGIIIRMYFLQSEHNPPHIHAIYNEDVAAIDFMTGEVLDGYLPNKALEMVREWISMHRVTRIIRTSFLATNIRHQFVKRLECINILSSAFSCC